MFLLIKTIHIIAMISWMAGLLYLPRLFVYHCEIVPNSPEDARFLQMERRLLRVIMTPAMIVTVFCGLYLMVAGGYASDLWMQIKLLLVAGLGMSHMKMAKFHRAFKAGNNANNAKFYRIFNEVPTILMIAIVALVVFKPN